MKKSLFVAVIALLVCSISLSANEVSMSIDTRAAGKVHLYCADAGSWNFAPSLVEQDGREFLTISINSPVEAVPPVFNLTFSFPQQDIHHLWHVNGDARFRFYPDWSFGMYSSLSSGMPLYELINDNDRNRFTMACDEVFRDLNARLSIREEGCVMYGAWQFFSVPEAPTSSYSTTVMFDARDIYWADAVRDAAQWMRESTGCVPCTVPDAAFEPLYSTWYQFHQAVFQKDIEEECAIASELGMKTIIIDDGWQTDDTNRGYAYCGDWKVSRNRFPEMKEHVARVHDMGMRYMMWYSVPFIGFKSENFARFEGKYLRYDYGLGAAVLDPRFPEVRQFLIDLYVDAMREIGLDGFKLDFIDSFVCNGSDPAVEDNYAGRDFKTVPAAVDELMRGVRDALQAERPDVLLEFRQQYVGTAIAQFGNMFRVGDCPGDLQANRIGICNLRLTSGPIAVHSDMIEWNLAESPECAARAIISALFGVIQYSVMLRDVPQAQQDVVKHWLAFSLEHRDALLKGSFAPHHPECGYPMVEAENDSEKIVAVYQDDMAVKLGRIDKPVYLINGSCASELVVGVDRKPSKVEAFDCYGVKVKAPKVGKGCSSVAIPVSGYVVIYP